MKLAFKIAGGVVVVLLILLAALAIYIYASALKPTRRVAFQEIEVPDPGHAPIAAAVWYPTSAKPGFVLLGSTGERVALNGAVDGEHLPLIVFSHGTGASSQSHSDTALALAENGFVVVAPTHTGDNFGDQSDVGKPDWLLNRSRHIERVIDMMLGSWKDRSHVDPRRIGIFGFSAGATTALITIGGVPDLRRISSQCAAHPEFVCNLVRPASYRDLAPQTWTADPRISAAVLAAPGLGFTFTSNGLSNVHAKIQLWAGSKDQTVPFATNAGLIARLLPRRPEVHVVPGGAHYSFLMPCGLIAPPQICSDNKDFDRAAFHRDFNASVVGFFEASLPERPAATQ